MHAVTLNPALSRLLRVKMRMKLQRLLHNFRSPRKFALSIAAVGLAIVWLGNAVVSMLFREPYSIETLQKWVPAALLAYAGWHLLKVAWKRPEVPIEWSPAEREMVCGGPFSRRQLLSYRLTAVMNATFFKALCASLLLFPDLPVWPAGFLGILLALAFLELLKMSLEIATHGVERRTYLIYRVGVFSAFGTIAANSLVTAFRASPAAGHEAHASTVHLIKRFLSATIELRETGLGRICEAPFSVFAHVITATHLFRLEYAGWLLAALVMVALMVWLVFQVDRFSLAAVIRAERAKYRPIDKLRGVTQNTSQETNAKLPHIWRLGGMGPLIWRQMIGAFEYKAGLLMALAAPALLSCIPLLQPLSPVATFIQVVGGLVFYSFLLLPAALKFDFRRDYDRLYAFKMLPLPPSVIVLGQLATPVLLTSAFQLCVLALTVFVRPLPAGYVVSAIVLMLPLNVLLFSAENLIFLLYPYRLNQEGIEVFLRTVLVFTAKGLFFALALVGIYVWSQVARNVAFTVDHWLGVNIPANVVFFFGNCAVVCVAAVVFTKLLVRAYQRYDPSLDDAG